MKKQDVYPRFPHTYLRSWSLLLVLLLITKMLVSALPDAAGSAHAAEINGMTWPASQAFPHFCCITTPLDQISIINLTNDQITLFVTLEGLINRSAPHIYIKDQHNENDNLWPQQMHLTFYPASDPYSMLIKYRSQIAGLIVDDPSVPDTLNLATTIAGLKNSLVASPQEAQKLSVAPYYLPILVDLRKNNFTSAVDVYKYAYDKYWPQTQHLLIAGLSTNTYGSLRDYIVATKAVVIWLDPRNAAQKIILDAFFKDVGAGHSYMGWWADEESGVRETSTYGIGTFASDLSYNLTVMGAAPHTIITQQSRLALPTLTNKTYVAIFLSDGDNIQLNQRIIATKWADPDRGKVPIGWTLSPALVDLAPAILNYYRSTATPYDELVSGPSGMGYAYPDLMSPSDLRIYTALTGDYLHLAGFDIITVWDILPYMPIAVGAAYQNSSAYPLLGITTQQRTNADLSGSRTYAHISSLSLSSAYASSEEELETAITHAASNFPTNNEPHFIAVQGNINNNGINPTTLYNVQQHFSATPNIAFVGPEELFLLMKAYPPHPLDQVGAAQQLAEKGGTPGKIAIKIVDE